MEHRMRRFVMNLFWLLSAPPIISPNPPTALQSVLLDTELATHNRTQIGADEEAHRNTTHHPATHPCDLGMGKPPDGDSEHAEEVFVVTGGKARVGWLMSRPV